MLFFGGLLPHLSVNAEETGGDPQLQIWQLDMTVEKTRYAVGEPIVLGLTLRNISKSSNTTTLFPQVGYGNRR
jgi:hypothetical protein